jgi:hypothetical protein
MAKTPASTVIWYWFLLVVVPPVVSLALVLVTPIALLVMAYLCAMCWISDRRRARSGGLPC